VTEDSFQRYYRQYYKPLVTYAFSIVKERAIAEDVIQQVFKQLWEIHTKRPIQKLYPYLITAVKHEALKHIKERGKTIMISDTERTLTSSFDNDDSSDSYHLLIKAIHSLPSKCKEIMLLKMQDGLTHQEIADYLQISKKTIENQVSIAHKKLRVVLTAKSPANKHNYE
jgi:RNA polymerase sigma-70 factor (ECF subfamily)